MKNKLKKSDRKRIYEKTIRDIMPNITSRMCFLFANHLNLKHYYGENDEGLLTEFDLFDLHESCSNGIMNKLEFFNGEDNEKRIFILQLCIEMCK